MTIQAGSLDPRSKVWSGYTRKSRRGGTLYDTMLSLKVTQQAWQDFMKFLPFGETGLLVDAGTGPGAIALDLAAKNPEARIMAFDPTLELLEVAKARAGAFRNVRFFCSDVTRRVQQVLDGTAKVVTINWVWCYLSRAEQYAAAAEIWRMLAPGGVVYGSAMVHPHTFKEVVGYNWPRELAHSPWTLICAMLELVPHITKPFDKFYAAGLANYPTLVDLTNQHQAAGFENFQILRGIMPVKKGYAAVIWKATKSGPWNERVSG